MLTKSYLPGVDTADDLRERARKGLPPEIFDHTIGGAGEERTMAANRAGFGRYRLLPRVLTDVSEINTEVELLGMKLAAPIFTCPTGGINLVHPDGERGIARAAATAGVGFMLSSVAAVTTEDLAAVAGPNRFQQLRWQGNRPIMEDLVNRAEKAGYVGIVLTVDDAVKTRRPRMVRNGYVAPAEVQTTNLRRYMTPEWSGVNLGSSADVGLTWENIGWLRSVIKMPFVLKGIMTAYDAVKAVDAGIDGIVVSNHGGRWLDGEPGTIEVLEEIVGTVQGRIKILIDGGFRRATDIVTALALGADAVGMGAPIVWALACGGEETVTAFLEDMVEDVGRTVGMVGAASIAGLTRDFLSRKDQYLPDWALSPFAPPQYK